MFKSQKLVLIASKGGTSARISYNPVTGKEKNKLVGEVEASGNVAALQLVNFTIGQLIEAGFTGRATIVTHDDVAGRAFQYRKATNAGLDPATEMVKDTMSDEYKAMIEEFCMAYEEILDSGADIRFVKMKNLHVWDLKLEDKFVPVTDENRALVGTHLVFEKGVSDKYVAQTNLLTGKFEVTTHVERIDGERIEVLALVRPANSIDMINVKKAESAVWALCPEVEMDFDAFDDESDAV